MTSSLVGSEMCIRDRELPAAGAATPPLQATKDPWQYVIDTCTKYTQANICLLYTSDAADDM
eukprot:2713697-Prorocentrum_lima.AAC.1